MTLHASRAERLESEFGALRLYREELEGIASIIAEECAGDLRIDFRDGRGWSGSDPSDLAQYAELDDIPEILRSLSLRGARGETTMAFEIDNRASTLVIENPDNGSRGAASQIREICEANRRFPQGRALLHNPDGPLPLGWVLVLAGVMFFAIVAGGLQLIAAVSPEGRIGDQSLPQVFIVLAIGFVGGGGVIAGQARPRSLLINLPRAERPPWWRRYRRDATLVLISGGVGYFVNQIPALWSVLSG